MAEFVKAASVTDIPSGSMRTLMVAGKKVALANVEGEFFAISDTCTHEECSLGTEGFLDEVIVTCGCHGATFDVTNGDVLSLPATQPVNPYKVKVEGDNIFIYV